MEQSPEILMVLNSLNKEKRELLDKVGEIDKVIKRIKYGNLKLGLSQGIAIDETNNEDTKPQGTQGFPLKADLKVQIIKIFDMIGVACRLKDVQDKHKELTGIYHNLRESLRNLNKHEILKLIQPK